MASSRSFGSLVVDDGASGSGSRAQVPTHELRLALLKLKAGYIVDTVAKTLAGGNASQHESLRRSLDVSDLEEDKEYGWVLKLHQVRGHEWDEIVWDNRNWKIGIAPDCEVVLIRNQTSVRCGKPFVQHDRDLRPSEAELCHWLGEQLKSDGWSDRITEECVHGPECFFLSLPLPYVEERASALMGPDAHQLPFLEAMANDFSGQGVLWSMPAIMVGSGWFGLSYEVQDGLRSYDPTGRWKDISGIFRFQEFHDIVYLQAADYWKFFDACLCKTSLDTVEAILTAACQIGKSLLTAEITY
ncbi:hypothetical protein KFL_008360120, partial [Klebsormidium nitens]